MDFFAEVRRVICMVRPEIDGSKVVWDALLYDDLGIGSLAMVEIALALEEAFGLYLPPEETEDIKTVGDIVSLIESKSRE